MSEKNNKPIIDCQNLVKIYKTDDLEVVALQGLDIQLMPGEIMALVGPSGAGKSTLLNVIGGLDTPSAGDVYVGGHDLLKMNDKDRILYKRETVGFVWQQPARNLLAYLTAKENVELPMMLSGLSSKARAARATELLTMVGLEDRLNFRPDRLSGGQQQRVALAVALANNPPILLGDELTGQVDSQSANEVFEALRRINHAYGTTIIIVTHDPQVSSLVDRVVAIRDGKTSTEIRRNIHGRDRHEEEWVILDRAGRLQIPAPFVDKLNLNTRVKIRLEDDHVSVWASGEQLHGSLTEELSEDKKYLQPILSAGKRKIQGAHIQINNLARVFQLGSEKIRAVDNVSLEIKSGLVTVFKGRSGSGKTTLLNLIADLDEPTSGEVKLDNMDLAKISGKQKIDLRRNHIGFIYQTFGLLPFLSAGENVQVPLRLVRAKGKYRREQTEQMLTLVGLKDRMHHRTYELSGGEQQRVAISRAIVNRPSLLLADEPTGQLDTTTGEAVIKMLKEIADEVGITVVIASHDPNVIGMADVVFELKDGKLVSTESRIEESTDKLISRASRLLTKGDNAKAGRILIDALQKDPEIAPAWYLLSYAFDDRDKKIYTINQAIRIDSSFDLAIKRKAEIEKEN